MRVYAIVENDEGGVFRSNDGGDTWTRTNDERKLRQRAFYYTRIYADPLEKDRVYVLNTAFYRSDDAGETFRPDHLGCPMETTTTSGSPQTISERMINGNDGGGNVSINGGRGWTDQDFPTAQFYRVITTAHEPYMVCGAQQDNSTACVAPRGWNHLPLKAGPSFRWAVVRAGTSPPIPRTQTSTTLVATEAAFPGTTTPTVKRGL